MPTYDELQAQIDRLQQEANEQKKKEKTTAIAEMKVKIAKYGISAAELGFGVKAQVNGKASSEKAVGAAKYRKRETGETWTGRGPAPKWLADEIAAGKKKEDFLINQ